MPHGDAAFSAEEIEADLKREEEQKREYEAKLANGFLQDGKVRKIIIEEIAKEDKVSRAGNAYILHTFTLKDTETGEEEVLADRDFAFVNALSPIKKLLGTDLRLGVTVLKLSIVKKGTREWNGVHYPTWAFTLELDSNPIDKLGDGKATAKAGANAEDVSGIPF